MLGYVPLDNSYYELGKLFFELQYKIPLTLDRSLKVYARYYRMLMRERVYHIPFNIKKILAEKREINNERTER